MEIKTLEDIDTMIQKIGEQIDRINPLDPNAFRMGTHLMAELEYYEDLKACSRGDVADFKDVLKSRQIKKLGLKLIHGGLSE